MKRRTSKFLTLTFFVIFLLSVSAQNVVAQEAPAGGKAPAPKDKKSTKIDFEDELVEGELKKPELFYLLQKKQFNFKRLIRLREDFLPEMRRDADEVRRSRSK
jgi:hypothetical protein